MRTVAFLSDDNLIEWLILSARKDPASLIGESFSFSDRKKAKEAQGALSEAGYTAYLIKKDVEITDYLPPATRDSDGFFIEDDALAARIRREQRQFGRDSIFPLLLTEQQRGDNEDVVGFIPGREEQPRYQDGYVYLQSDILWYSNFLQCLRMVIPTFDVYGMGYYISWKQWQEIKSIAEVHGPYARNVAEELDRWLQTAAASESDKLDSEVDSEVDSDTAMTIMCI